MKRYNIMATAVLFFVFAFCGSVLAQLTTNVYEHQWGEGQVNVNTATRDQLVWFLGLSSIGDPNTVADNILTYRNSNGPFDTIDELKNVEGVDQTVLDRVQYRVKVAGTTNYDPEVSVPAPGFNQPRSPDNSGDQASGRGRASGGL